LSGLVQNGDDQLELLAVLSPLEHELITRLEDEVRAPPGGAQVAGRDCKRLRELLRGRGSHCKKCESDPAIHLESHRRLLRLGTGGVVSRPTRESLSADAPGAMS